MLGLAAGNANTVVRLCRDCIRTELGRTAALCPDIERAACNMRCYFVATRYIGLGTQCSL